MTREKRTAAMLLAALLAAVMLFSVFFIVLEADHDCAGEDCAVCAVLSVCEELLTGRSAAASCIAAAVLAAVVTRSAARLCAVGTGSVTPVSLKVKLSD